MLRTRTMGVRSWSTFFRSTQSSGIMWTYSIERGFIWCSIGQNISNNCTCHSLGAAMRVIWSISNSTTPLHVFMVHNSNRIFTAAFTNRFFSLAISRPTWSTTSLYPAIKSLAVRA